MLSEAENFKNYNANCNKVNAEISGNLHRRFPKDLCHRASWGSAVR